ncbi:MAG: beta-ketoacyl-[acyl-carrier-protein] synthase family protein [Bacteriovoracaceae bacterium]|jgi:3-oxoacyl-[acyl-carrier-protein] synthase II|nr:beta-ketoacyl-[acyl-carrier-protein] synthase family protein [Bacteriovoracaceae bacterium]
MNKRIVITGVGLTSPIGNNLQQMRTNLLDGKSGITSNEIRYMGQRPAGLCDFDEFKYQKKKTRRRGTRAGSIAIYCANEAVNDAKVDSDHWDKSRVGVFLGLTEHGNVETEEEVYQMHQNDMDYNLWSIHHNPRTVANSPAGEVTLNLGISGPHFTVGSACAGGNMGLIQGVQQILLGEVDSALCGGVSESPATFGIFAAFNAQGALGSHDDPAKASRPLCKTRNGIVISEGGCVYHIETLESAEKRNAKIYGEIVGYAYNSDATDFVLPNTQRQIECMNMALKRANVSAQNIDIVNLHATGTVMGDINEVAAVKEVFGTSKQTAVNFTKGHIGHSMGAAGALELAGNLPSFEDGMIHPGINVQELDEKCAMDNLVINKAKETNNVNIILNNSFGMLGINSSVIIKKI